MTDTNIPGAPSAATFQARVRAWLEACFGAEIADDAQERNHRFLEEALELVQAQGCSAGEAHQLVDYVFGRPAGAPKQEVGGVMLTLGGLCHATGLDMVTCGEAELARAWSKIEQIRAKQAAKPKHSPLPAPAPMPISVAYDTQVVEVIGPNRAFLEELIDECANGDIDEDSEHAGWAHLVREAKRMLGELPPEAPMPDDARLLQLLADICRAAQVVQEGSATDENLSPACWARPDDMAHLEAALAQANEAEEPDQGPEHEGWQRVIEALRRRLAAIATDIATAPETLTYLEQLENTVEAFASAPLEDVAPPATQPSTGEAEPSARDLLAQVLDVWDDGQHPPENRAYVEGSLGAVIIDIRKFLANQPSELAQARGWVPVYTTKIGEAVEKYINSLGGRPSQLPARFRWSECFDIMLSAAAKPPAPDAVAQAGQPNLLMAWACERWRDEVEYRPLVNVHRRTLDGVWRRIVRFAGGDPDELLGPSHDVLLGNFNGGDDAA